MENIKKLLIIILGFDKQNIYVFYVYIEELSQTALT